MVFCCGTICYTGRLTTFVEVGIEGVEALEVAIGLDVTVGGGDLAGRGAGLFLLALIITIIGAFFLGFGIEA